MPEATDAQRSALLEEFQDVFDDESAPLKAMKGDVCSWVAFYGIALSPFV